MHEDHQSKYFEKHYTVDYAQLDETQCPYNHCRGIFAVDYRWLHYQVMDDGDFAVISCPYCHKTFKEAI